MQDYRIPGWPPMGKGPMGTPIGTDPSQKKKGYSRNLTLDKTGAGY